ncbi:uncharacterized protein MONOS_10583 [Monocercomonoides exilis]|uniref:uncharacterized protein n=1 Tax=Monocercomonoides exilis TaxID=2049356 RepID=UPI003559A98C|nr:hypothetical protein MONOS_10583 [Monocercomonoides exilis]|eukprot:MONOS_10583.1-p1 / transcript=MONOS_10583.1 / gene=MONOS_10583 / organism=Monocercomonoides_exilis_PA203 / gene_product=unspecified product / transcript_product=unspecified product / location=Mono_scaffold00486:38436-38997(+) / protein_length=113 / sequence_SO=supercontig / SO=protein_coding / is_pseudo=false
MRGVRLELNSSTFESCNANSSEQSTKGGAIYLNLQLRSLDFVFKNLTFGIGENSCTTTEYFAFDMSENDNKTRYQASPDDNTIISIIDYLAPEGNIFLLMYVETPTIMPIRK